MADWSNLPIELLDLIAEHLETEIDIIWFRSVCSTWQSSVGYNPHPMPSFLPSLPNQGISDTSSGFYLCKSTILQLGLPQPNSQTLPSHDGWLIKVEQGACQSYLLNPLSRSKFWPLPDSFPTRLNLFKFKVSELGHEYILRHVNHHPFQNTIRSACKLYFCLKACSISGIQSSKVLTIHVSGKLQMFKFGDQKWTIMDNFPSVYDDIVLFDGQFYAVDRTGRTVIVNADASPVVSLAADSVFGGDKKILVESCGELFLVDRYMSGGVRVYEQFRWYVKDRTARFKVFRLVPDEKKWVSVGNLGDRMFFLGDNCTFSTSASNFSGCKGNCIFFTDHHSGWSKQEGGDGVGVFDLETGGIGSLANYPDYSNLFWPPPNWVSSIMLEEERAERSEEFREFVWHSVSELRTSSLCSHIACYKGSRRYRQMANYLVDWIEVLFSI